MSRNLTLKVPCHLTYRVQLLNKYNKDLSNPRHRFLLLLKDHERCKPSQLRLVSRKMGESLRFPVAVEPSQQESVTKVDPYVLFSEHLTKYKWLKQTG